jgi:hypothetical protein
MDDDTLSLVVYGLIGGAIAIHALLRYLRRDREITVSTQDSLGAAEGMTFGVVATYDARRYLSLEYETGNDPPQPVQVLLTSEQGARLAKLLRIAATPGRTLAVARAVERRRASGRQARG